MSASTDLRALIVGASAVTALVGLRVRFERAEEDEARPFIVINLSDTERDYALDGTLLASKTVFSVQCWGNTRASANAVADAVLATCVAADRFVTGPAGDYVPDLDVEGAILTVDWWDD